MPSQFFLASLESELGIIQVRGPDAGKFLQGQFSSDLQGLAEGQGQWSSYSTAKGRMIANFYILRQEDVFFLLLAADLAEDVVARLLKFRLMAKVDVSRMENQGWSLLGVWGEGAGRALASTLQGTVPEETHRAAMMSGGLLLLRTPWGEPAWWAAGPAAPLESLGQKLEETGGARTGADGWRHAAIVAGTAFITRATSEQVIPQELNLEVLGGISFKKGCYPGQEIVARTHYLGRLKNQCYRIQSPAEMHPGEHIFTPDMGDQAIGTVISAARDGDGHTALAVLRAANAQDSLHLGSLAGPRIGLGTLPYALPLEQDGTG